MTAPSHAIGAIETFIGAVNQLDPDKAGNVLAPGGKLVFPGGNVFTDVAVFLDWARNRYRRATYDYHSYETIERDGLAIVFARGSIAGELNNGSLFEGIRIIDRFEIRDGKIVSKEVWSDMADYLRKMGL